MEPTIDKIDSLVIELFGGEVIAQGEISEEVEREFFEEHLDEEQKKHKRIFEDIRFNQELHNQRANIVSIQKRMEAQMNELEQKQAELQSKLQKSEDVLFDVIGTEEAKEEIKAKDKIEPEPPPQAQALAVEAPPTPTAATAIANANNQMVITKSINDNIAQYQEEFKPLLKIGSIYRTAKSNNILYNFLKENGVNFIVGKGGIGKSYLSYHLVIDLLKQNYHVFYIDMDNPDDIFIERGLKDEAIKIGKGDFIKYFNNEDYEIAENDEELSKIDDFKFSNNATFAARIINYIKKYKQRFSEQRVIVFIDSLQNIIDDFSIERMSSGFMRFLRKTARKGLTLVILHHTNKQGEQFKGFTVIRDAADMMYTISGVLKDNQNKVTDFILKSEKNRYNTAEKIRFMLLGNYEFEIAETVFDNIVEDIIARLTFFALNKYKELQKMQLNKHIKSKMPHVGRTKINEILDKFVDLEFLNKRQGDKAAVFLSLNEESDIFKKLKNEIIDELEKHA